MTTSPELHVVLGGTGAAGSAIVRELDRAGLPVRAVSRRAPDRRAQGWSERVEHHSADLTRPASLSPALRGATTVCLAAQPAYHRWPEEFPALLDAVLAALDGHGARLVMVDNLYAYGPVVGPIHEGLPPAATDRKGRTRALMARRLLDAYRAGRVPVTIGRAADFYGPGVAASAADDKLFRAVLAGRAVRWPVRLDQPHSLSYIADFARALLLLGRRDEAPGRIWHVPAAEPLTGRAFIELIGREAGVPARPAALPRALVQLLGLVSPPAREFAEMFYGFGAPFVLDGSDFARTFGFTPTPHAEAVRQTLAWLRRGTA